MTHSALSAESESGLPRLLTDPRSFAEPEPIHKALAWARSHDPVRKVEAPGFDPFWLITRHADILEIERQADIFRNEDRSTVLVPRDMREAIEAKQGSPHLTRSVVNMDGSEHRTYRMLTQAWFVAGSLRKLEGRIREIARQAVDRMLERGATRQPGQTGLKVSGQFRGH